MKSLLNYINKNKQINESKCIDELKKSIQDAKDYDFIPYLWGVTEIATKPADSGAYMVDCVLHLEKRKGDKFVPVSNMIFDGHELIEKACKDKGWNKLRRFFDFGMILSAEQAIELINVLPKYFNEYIGKKDYVKALSFDYDDIYKTCATMSKPYQIKTLEDEIKSIENQMKQLDDKKSQLEKLKNSKDDE